MFTGVQRVDGFHYVPEAEGGAKLEIVISYGEGHQRTDTFTLREFIKALQLPDHNPTLITLWGLVQMAIKTKSLDTESHKAFIMFIEQLAKYTGENAPAEYVGKNAEDAGVEER